MSWRDVVIEICFWVLAMFAVVGCATLLYLASGWPPGVLMIISMMIVPALLIGGSLVSHKLGETYFYVLALFAVSGCAKFLYLLSGKFDAAVMIFSFMLCVAVYGIGAVLSDAPDYEGN